MSSSPAQTNARGHLLRRTLSLFSLLGVLLGWSPHAYAQQSCGPFANSLPIALTATVTYVGGATQNLSTSFVHDRSQLAQCGTARQDLVGQPGCAPGQLPLARLLGEVVLVAADRQVGLFDLSCGNLSGTFTLGNPPFAQISGTFSLRFGPGARVTMSLSASIPSGPGFDELFTGAVTVSESFHGVGAGVAQSGGSLQVSTTSGTGSMPLSISYQLLGNSSAVMTSSPMVKQTLSYDCSTGTLSSQLCPPATSAASAPSSSWLSLVLLALLLCGVAVQRVRGVGHARA